MTQESQEAKDSKRVKEEEDAKEGKEGKKTTNATKATLYYKVTVEVCLLQHMKRIHAILSMSGAGIYSIRQRKPRHATCS